MLFPSFHFSGMMILFLLGKVCDFKTPKIWTLYLGTQSQQQVLGQLRGHGQFSQDLVIQNLPSGETLSLQVALPACTGACQGTGSLHAPSPPRTSHGRLLPNSLPTPNILDSSPEAPYAVSLCFPSPAFHTPLTQSGSTSPSRFS